MKFAALFAIAGLCLLFVLPATGATSAKRPLPTRDGIVIHGGNAAFDKAGGDTIQLMGPTGSGAPYLGDFEAGWNGWTSIDITQPTISHWQVSDYNQTGGNHAAWCGELGFASCNDSLDVAGGYGNAWYDILAYRVAVANPGAGATVQVVATLQHNTEPGYDFVRLSQKIEGQLGFTNINSWDGAGTVAVNENITYLPAELVDGTDVLVVFRVLSDGGWSDEDCSYYGNGACQVDNVTVTTAQVGEPDMVSFTDFESGFGDWTIVYPDGVGDFAQLRSNLKDLDPCRTNTSRQVAFIDDGVVVPGTGGSSCINWCYGPGGYVVNSSGGLAGSSSVIDNEVWSPVMNWPSAGSDGIIFSFDAYRHEELDADSPAIFFTWGIRSADTDGSAGNGSQTLASQPFRNRNFVYYGGPDYNRQLHDVSDLMNPGRDVIQVMIDVFGPWWGWGWIGHDATPAPYFDNVSVKVFSYQGPVMTAREVDLAQDNFPEVDAIDFGDLGSLHVRFDMANNISPAQHLRNDPGDSIVATVKAVRTGAALVGAPAMHYVIDANPVFNPYRTTPVSGVVPGVPAAAAGVPSPDQWAFDLPDSGTLFPGDVLHYYIRAGDDAGGDIRYATLPADLTGYGDFAAPLRYNHSFVVHALPTITEDGAGGYHTPAMIFWNDFADRGGEDEWYQALQDNAAAPGTNYDIYYTNGPSSGVGNGIGGRTSGPALVGYTTLLYTSGGLGVITISNGDFAADAGDDIGALNYWLASGNRNIILSGDNLASDLAHNGGAATLAFSEDVMGLDLATDDVRTFIGNQSAPLVATVPGNPVFQTVTGWIAYGSCPTINRIDGVTARSGATRLAEFTDESGNAGAYPYAAAVYNVHNGTNRIVSLPYDLMNIYTALAKSSAPESDRSRVLGDVLDFFGGVGLSPVPPRAEFTVTNHPNPFNPSTRIAYTIRAPGHLTVKVFNVRGQLVKTLVDAEVTTDDFVVWDGSDDQGGDVASGVYFYEARLDGEVEIGKMTLVR